MSASMDLSSGETAYTTCPAPAPKADKMPIGAMLQQLGDVKDLKRSRFDEVENYKKVGHVGSGGYGNCLLLQKRSNQTLRVCKVQKRTKELSEPLEIEILRDILHDHPRIVRLHEAITHTHTMQLYFDYYPGGDLFQFNARYMEYWEPVPESFIWHCFLQLSEALAYIHHGYDRRQLSGSPSASEWQSIIHGDVKPENVFLGPPTEDSHGYPSLVLGDFGLATIDECPVPGTWKWQPPELPMTSTKADVWALGAIIHFLAHDGRPPLRQRPQWMPHRDFFRWPEARQPISFFPAYSTELHNLVIHGALEFDPEFRYSSLQVLHNVIYEVEMGVASDMHWEAVIGPGYKPKTFDENGVTERSDASPADDFEELENMKFCEVEPMVVDEAMEPVPCY